MSSGLDTATRRQVRKAFGGTAMEVIEAHEQGLRAHAQTLQQQAAAIECGRINLDALATRFLQALNVEREMRADEDTQLRDRHDYTCGQMVTALGAIGRVTALTERSTFWQRLRWLLRGK
jgi:hypothetical protein